MRIILTVSDKDPAARGLVRQLVALNAPRSARRSLSPFPFSLLERALLAGLDGLEAVVRRAVTAVVRTRAG